jgi:hypothetical protein
MDPPAVNIGGANLEHISSTLGIIVENPTHADAEAMQDRDTNDSQPRNIDGLSVSCGTEVNIPASTMAPACTNSSCCPASTSPKGSYAHQTSIAQYETEVDSTPQDGKQDSRVQCVGEREIPEKTDGRLDPSSEHRSDERSQTEEEAEKIIKTSHQEIDRKRSPFIAIPSKYD